MTTSKRLAERKVEKFENVVRRGSKKGSKFSTAHIVLAVFAVVIVASYIFQMIRVAMSDKTAQGNGK